MEKKENFLNENIKNNLYKFFQIKQIKNININDFNNIGINLINIYNLNNISENKIIKLIIFLLFGIIEPFNLCKFKLENFEESFYKNELILFRNYFLNELILILNLEKNNLNDLINNQTIIIKSNFIKKCFHVIKNLFIKNIENYDLFFYKYCFLYKKYKFYFINFINSNKCLIKEEFKEILINEFNNFDYLEKSILDFGNKIFFIKLAEKVFYEENDSKKIENFFEQIKYKNFKNNLNELYNKIKKKNIIIIKENKNNEINNQINFLQNEILNLKSDFNILKNNQIKIMDQLSLIINLLKNKK